MNQVSRPMQILLGAVVLFAVVWFLALRPKTVEEPVAATPATPAAAPASDAGGAAASTGLGQAVESANNAAASSNAATAKSEAQTGEAPSAAAAPAETPATPAEKTETAAADKAAAKAKVAEKKKKAAKAKRDAKQDAANAVIRSIQRDLKAGRAVVTLVYSPNGKEDKLLEKRIKKDINRRGGRVRTYFINVSQVGYYDGLLSGLNLSQTPSTIVIAPDNQAKVLGGVVSTERIDRLTSAAIQTPAATTP